MPDELLTVAEIAERLKLNPQTIRNWITAGKLPAVRVGARRVRVRRSDFDQFLQDAAASSQPETLAVGGDLDETAVAAWAELGIALADATAALGDQDRRKLAVALAALAEAAGGLSRTLEASTARKDEPA